MTSLLGRLKNGSKGVLTLSLEGSSLRLLRSQDGRVASWTNLPFNPRLVREGRIEDPAGLAEVIKNGLNRVGGGNGPLVASYPGTRMSIRVLALPRLRDIRPDVVVPREARRMLGAAADQQLLFWTPLAASPLELRYFLLAVPRAELARFLETLQLSGLKPRKIDARPLALARAVQEPSAIIVRLEATDLDVTIVVDRVPQIVARRAVEIGMNIEDLVSEMVDVTQTSVAFLAGRSEGSTLPPDAPIVVVGGHPFIDEPLLRTVREETGRQVRFPASPVQAAEDFPTLEFMVNLGLVLKRL